MGKIRNTKSGGSVGMTVLALMNGGKPYDVPPPKKDGTNHAISTVQIASKPLLVVTRQMQSGDLGAFDRFSQVL